MTTRVAHQGPSLAGQALTVRDFSGCLVFRPDEARAPPLGPWSFTFVGVQPCGRWLTLVVCMQSPTGVGSYKQPPMGHGLLPLWEFNPVGDGRFPLWEPTPVGDGWWSARVIATRASLLQGQVVIAPARGWIKLPTCTALPTLKSLKHRGPGRFRTAR